MTAHTDNIAFLPTYCKARVLILGVGNVMFSDDGFGPEVVEALIENYLIPDDIYVMDVGTGVRKLLFTLTLSQAKPEEIIVVDAVDWGQDLGQVIEIGVEDLPSTKIDDFSLHQVPTSNMLKELQDLGGIKVAVIACDVGILPQVIQPGLRPDIKSSVSKACDLLAERYLLVKKS